MNAATRRAEPRGILPFDKPQGWSSARAVSYVKRRYGGIRTGHGGTLDPMATGMLPLALGRATRLLSYVFGQTKRYNARVRLGLSTTTADSEGEALHRFDFSRPSELQLKRLLKRFVGEQWQVPPMHSAIHYRGRRLYEYARRGVWIPRKPRRITINFLRLCAVHDDGFSFAVSCSSGTYLRTLAEDLARMLSTAGHLAELRRLSVGALNEEHLVKAEHLSACAGDQQKLRELLLPPDAVILHLPLIRLSDDQGSAFCHGRPVYCSSPPEGTEGDCAARVYSPADCFLGVGLWQRERHCLRPQLTMPGPPEDLDSELLASAACS